MFTKTTATNKIIALTKRIRAIQGGTSASKTISALLYLIARCQYDYTCEECNVFGCRDKKHTAKWVMKPTLTSVVSESLPHLKRGAIKDFLLIMKTHNYYKEDSWNKTDFTYTFETGSRIEFFGADSPEKVRGPRRQRLFMNECNNMAFETFDQLEVRTEEFVMLDWNPTNEFWFYDLIKPGHENYRDDIDHIILTYKDNEGLPKAQVESIEKRKKRAGWWKVYGEGQLGEVDGKIYTGWQIIGDVPHEARLERFGIDFGWNDPAAVVAIYRYNGGYILDEVFYGSGKKNKELADTILNHRHGALAVADSAEPKSIAELQGYGVNTIAAVKGRDSVRYGIQRVQNERISVTARSENIIREYKNYMWELDKMTNKPIEGSPEHEYSHTMDAIRYGIVSMVGLEIDAIEEDWGLYNTRFR